MAESMLRVIPSAENHARGKLWWRGRSHPCALGRGGVLPASRKREGDEASPAGLYPLLGVYYRADRLDLPETVSGTVPGTELPARVIGPDLGWCDDPGCADYNSAVDLPHPGSAECLWRADGLYDLLLVTGHNCNPVLPGLGSAIFVHVARDDFSPTRGCVAIARDVLLGILPALSSRTMMRIHMP